MTSIPIGITIGNKDEITGHSWGMATALMPDGFPAFEYFRWRMKCDRRWGYYSGDVWEEKIQLEGDQEIYRFPLKLNPLKEIAAKHVSVLFGEVPDNADQLVQMRPIHKRDDEISRKIASEIEDALQQVMYETASKAVFLDAARLSQFLGVSVFKLSWRGSSFFNKSGVYIERVIPDYFWCRMLPGGSYELREGWSVRAISIEEAKNVYNVEIYPADTPTMASVQRVPYVEHWTKDRWQVTVANRQAQQNVNGEWTDLAGDNPYGFVPYIVIPHIRAGDWTGESIVDGNESLLAEKNARFADVGDAVASESNIVTTLSGQISTTSINIIPGVRTIRTGGGIPGGEQPELKKLELGKVSPGMIDFVREIDKELTRATHMTDVARGEDEGNQRSALTLAFRMWPLTAHARQERMFWETGLQLMATMITKMLEVHSSAIAAIDPECPAANIGKRHQNHRFSIDWAPMVPRDREQMVNEIIMRFGAGLISFTTASEQFSDIRDTAEEMALILEYKAALAEIENKALEEQQVDTGDPVPTSSLEN